MVKSQGDGYLVAFAHPVEAVQCGIAVRRAFDHGANRARENDPAVHRHPRGQVRGAGDGLFGRNVALAARVAGEADYGEILVSESVRDTRHPPVYPVAPVV